MDTSTSSLDNLRRRIDEIDDQLHDLIMQRAEIVEAVGRAKKHGNATAIRPGREAFILRRLLQRHHGWFPRPALARIWRELISGSVAMQGDFSVAVCVPPESAGYWDLARDHYGTNTPMAAYGSTGEVLRAVAEGRASIGVLPMPIEGESEPWWPQLAFASVEAPHIIARLPFIGRGNVRGDGGDALVVGHGDPEQTGADRSLVMMEIGVEVSRARIISALGSAGLVVTLFEVHKPSAGIAWCLIELDDLVSAEDPRLIRAATSLGDIVLRMAWLGAYAQPLAPALLNGAGLEARP